jgi:hypothetical protein
MTPMPQLASLTQIHHTPIVPSLNSEDSEGLTIYKCRLLSAPSRWLYGPLHG